MCIINNHLYVLKTGEVNSDYAAEKSTSDDISLIFRERPYFVCYLNNL